MRIKDSSGRELILTKTTLSEVYDGCYTPVFEGRTHSKLLLRDLDAKGVGTVPLIGLNGPHEGKQWFHAVYDLRKDVQFPYIGCRALSMQVAEKIRKAIRAAKTKKKGTPKKKKK